MANSSWELLERAGVPTGAARSSSETFSDVRTIAFVVGDVPEHADGLDSRQRVSLLAWLSAWASGWPTSFRAAFPAGDEMLRRAAAGVDDVDRYLKLRRIARANLARFL